MRRIFPASFYNIITLAGLAIAAVSLGLIVFLTVIELFTEEQKPYMGILAFVILPVFLLLGLAIAVAGIIRDQRRSKRGKPHGLHLPVIDLNNPSHRKALTLLSGGTVLLLAFSAFGSFKAYEYTDSTAFCGQMCHDVMNPEFVAYQYSPHARVGCVECHIGSGATWFVRSKLSGSYQLYATLFNKYPRPIPTPIENLRPAQETCERCHWPKVFYSEKLHQKTYYIADEENSKWTLSLLMKIGGGNVEAGPTSGIHWHMNIANEVTYATIDSQRQVIAWVKSKMADGTETLYRNTDLDLSEEDLAQAEVRRMDCIDCHNRPSHIYHPPGESVNTLMSLGWVDPSLPGVKGIAVQALEGKYSSTVEADSGIRSAIEEFYESNYPEAASKRRQDIERLVGETQKVYSRNYFPEMKVDWKGFINNIGHLYYPGCFRCHDGSHTTEDGVTLSRDCGVCHTILAQEYGRGAERVSLTGVEYIHPVDIGDAWKEMRCSDCHHPE